MPKKDEVQLARAKSMRSHIAGPEARLWHHLRGKRLDGHKFTRQVLIGPYIADFAARLEKLVVEIDGDTHAGREEYDADRTVYLNSQGFRVVRFSNLEVMGNIEGVLEVILRALLTAPLPNPLPRGEREQEAAPLAKEAASPSPSPLRGEGRGEGPSYPPESQQ